jgi:hypothetical protein
MLSLVITLNQPLKKCNDTRDMNRKDVRGSGVEFQHSLRDGEVS